MNRKKRIFYPVNENIRAQELRVIDQDGVNLGVISRSEALKKAWDQELDLVVIAERANPPVARITEFSKFKYEQKKAEAKKRSKNRTEFKQLRFRPNIDDHDLQVRINRARQFLAAGSTVKFTVPFFGRIITHKEVGHEKLDRVWAAIEDIAQIEKERRMDGNFMTMVVRPK